MRLGMQNRQQTYFPGEQRLHPRGDQKHLTSQVGRHLCLRERHTLSAVLFHGDYHPGALMLSNTSGLGAPSMPFHHSVSSQTFRRGSRGGGLIPVAQSLPNGVVNKGYNPSVWKTKRASETGTGTGCPVPFISTSAQTLGLAAKRVSLLDLRLLLLLVCGPCRQITRTVNLYPRGLLSGGSTTLCSSRGTTFSAIQRMIAAIKGASRTCHSRLHCS